MRGFEHGGAVADVGARGQADATGHGGRGIGEIIAVEVRRSDHAVFIWAELNLLEHAIGNPILDKQLPLPVGSLGNLVLRDDPVAKFGPGQVIAPILERPLGELHDVALVHERDARQFLVEGIANGHAHEPLGPFRADRLDAYARGRSDVVTHLLE